MIKLVKIQIDPTISFELKNELPGTRQVLFVWEDAKYNTPLFTDIVTLADGINAFSSLNKPLSFFPDGITFKVIDLTNQELLFSHTAHNLSFIRGRKILYVSQNNHTGYGFAARNCIYQLLTQGYDVQWVTDILSENQTQYVPSNEFEKSVNECRNRTIDYDCVIIHHVPIDYDDLMTRLKIKPNVPIYVSTVWETTHVHQSWCDILNNFKSLTGVIVPSQFNVDVFKRSNINHPIHLWNYDIFPITDKTEIEPVLANLWMYKNGEYTNDISTVYSAIISNTVFYNISQYSTRKNIDQIVRTFCKTYDGNDKVCLLLKTFFKTFTNQEKEYIKYKIKSLTSIYEKPPTILLCLDDLNTEQINVLHKLSDIYFTLNRGEGFGLCSYTAKKFGNRVICGGFGSESEFVDENDCIVPYSLEKPHGMITFHNLYDGDNQLWASYDDNDVVHCLKQIKLVKK